MCPPYHHFGWDQTFGAISVKLIFRIAEVIKRNFLLLISNRKDFNNLVLEGSFVSVGQRKCKFTTTLLLKIHLRITK